MSLKTSAGRATVRLLCATFGISRAAYYATQKTSEKPANVIRLHRRPTHASAETVLAGIREVLAENPAWGVRKVWATLRRRGVRVGRNRVHAIMKANGLVLARGREPGEVLRGHVTTPKPNRRWATDLTTVWTLRDGWVAVAPVIDCGCRSVLALDVTREQDAPHVLAPVERALREAFGDATHVPPGLELRTDHGPQYTGADAGDLAKEWGLMHTYAPVGRPTGNAVVERLNRTMKEEVVWLRDWKDADELRAALLAWVERYNTERPHQALDWQTPAERRAERLAPALKLTA